MSGFIRPLQHDVLLIWVRKYSAPELPARDAVSGFIQTALFLLVFLFASEVFSGDSGPKHSIHLHASVN